MAEGGEEIFIERIALIIYALLFIHLGGEALALLIRIIELAEAVGDLDTRNIDLETFGNAWVARMRARQRRLGAGIFVENDNAALKLRLDLVLKQTAEDVGPESDSWTGVPAARAAWASASRSGAPSGAIVESRSISAKRVKAPGNSDTGGLRGEVCRPPAIAELAHASRPRGQPDDLDRIVDHRLIRGAGAIPFEHGEFRAR